MLCNIVDKPTFDEVWCCTTKKWPQKDRDSVDHTPPPSVKREGSVHIQVMWEEITNSFAFMLAFQQRRDSHDDLFVFCIIHWTIEIINKTSSNKASKTQSAVVRTLLIKLKDSDMHLLRAMLDHSDSVYGSGLSWTDIFVTINTSVDYQRRT